MYTKIKQRHKDNNSDLDLDTLIWCLIARYKMLRSYNQQLAVHPNILQELNTCYALDFELFGSALNAHSRHYCSIFYDIEKHFGSKGSFFNLVPLRGFYSMNPPFDEHIIKSAVIHVVQHMQKTMDNVSIIIWIPVWDHEGKTVVNKQCEQWKGNKLFKNMRLRKLKGGYGRYEGMDIINESGLIRYKRIVCLQSISYVNYINMKVIHAAHTHVIVLQNTQEFDETCIDNMNLLYDVIDEGIL